MSDFYNKLIGNNIRFVREEKGMTLSDLGHLCDLTKQAILRIEKGNGTTTKTFFQIASALELPPQAFLSKSMQVTRKFSYVEENK